jgi:hypothetical protein
MDTGISRRLSYVDTNDERRIICQDDIHAIDEPVVILGDPGSGKSVLTRALGDAGSAIYYRAGTFIRATNVVVPDGARIIIDGLDEIASTALGGGVDDVLSRLSSMGNPAFILSCREADWRGAADRIKIEDDYSRRPKVLHLLPFDRDDAVTFLQAAYPAIEAAATLDHLSDRGLEEIYRNPLTLRLLGEVAQVHGALPNTRAELFDRACRVMLREENPRHEGAPHAQRADEDLLLSAGALCAVQLLCDRSGIISRGPTVESWARLPELAALPLAGVAADALHTRLFQAEGENRFSPIHRVIAEYLGAKWIAACFEAGVSERRIFSLFLQGDGVPTSLRGLHAWTAHFSEALAQRCIAADPYAVLAYGDADTLGLDAARTLLAALARLSADDPHFRSGDWVDYSAQGLMRPELKDDLLAIVTTPRTHVQLSALLLGAMVRTPIIQVIAPELRHIALDTDRYYVERLRAAEALLGSEAIDDVPTFLQQLLNEGDADSARLAGELLGDLALDRLPDQLIVEILLAHLGLTVSHLPRTEAESHSQIAYIPSSLAHDLVPERLSTFLDLFTEYAWPLVSVAERLDSSAATDFIRKLVLRRCEQLPPVPVPQLWGWLSGAAEADSYDNETRTGLARLFQNNPDLRSAIIRHVMLDQRENGVRSEAYGLGHVSSGLHLTANDIADLLSALGEWTGADGPNRDAWESLVLLSRTEEGIPPVVRDAAIVAARGSPDLIAALDRLSVVEPPPWRVAQAKREAESAAKRQEIYRSHREAHKARAAEVAAGSFGDLDVPADVYLGRIREFSRDDTPMVRLEAFLGEELAQAAADGFIAVLYRTDLPGAEDIARLHAERRHWTVEEPMICGAAEMIRRGLPLEALPRSVLNAVMMAWRRSSESHVVGGVNIGPALVAAVFTNEAEIEAHFRRSIESQLLAMDKTHVEDLYWLCQTPDWAGLAGRLCAEWLIKYPGLPERIMAEMLHCALDKADYGALASMLAASRSMPAADFDALRLWLTAEFELNFEASRDALAAAAADASDFFWILRPRLERQRHSLRSDLSVAQLSFVVSAFASSWPYVPRPGGATIGDSNPWDATQIIERTIYALAASPSPEATTALQNLIRSGVDDSYVDTLRHALGLQRKARRDHEYVAPSVDQLVAVMDQRLPESIDDMRAYLADRIETFQARVHGSNTDIWQAFWRTHRPQTENVCRNRLVDYISGLLPPSIRFEPEMHMPEQKRADIAAIRNTIGLPVEIKGQWHPALWTAPLDQLAAQYVRDWHAEGRGVYIVLWFGDGVSMPLPPDGHPRPTAPEALRTMLVERLPEERRDQIDVYVIDLTRP